jgi:hypothetical protein
MSDPASEDSTPSSHLPALRPQTLPALLPQAPRDRDAAPSWWSRLKDILATVFAIVFYAGVAWAFIGAMWQ